MSRKHIEWPTISVIIPAYNEWFNLTRLFASLNRQSYPRDKIEYLFVNDHSTDESEQLAKGFETKIINVETHDIELNKGIGMHAATNEYIYWLDADMEIFGNDFWQRLVLPLEENPKLMGSFTNEFSLAKDLPWEGRSLLRYISYDPLQRDPVYQYFSESIDHCIIETMNNYALCKFQSGRIPPCGRMMYHREKLLATDVNKNKSFIDLESLEIVVRVGWEYFAYVPKAKIRHYHALNLTHLISKRLRNLEKDYLPNITHQKYYIWFDLGKPQEVLRIIWWIIYANLFFPALIKGMFLSVKHHDLAFMWEPIVTIVTTDTILWGFITQKTGRGLIIKMLRTLTLKFGNK